MPNFIANLGGAFLYSENPRALAQWYETHLGFQPHYMGDSGECYQAFHYRDKEDPGDISAVSWAILKAPAGTAAAGHPRVMLNYRVRDMAALLAHLSGLGVEPDDYAAHPGQGKFAHLTDPEGNRIELWEDGFVHED